MKPGRVQPQQWGPKEVGIGVGLAVLSFVFTSGLLVALTALVGSEYALRDIGDTFDKLSAVAQYADERLVAAAGGRALPDPPRLLADLTTVKLGFATTLFYEALLVAVVGGTTKETYRGLIAALGLDSYSPTRLWRPALAAIAGYVLVVAYAIAADATGIDLIRPQSTIPDAVTRDTLTLAMAGVLACIAAPVSEELFFRGFLFTGLLRWGVLPAAAISAVAFSMAHFDPGSVIPFFGIGLLMAWLYWSRGSLWDSIAFHFMFNSVSFSVLIFATKG